MSRRRRRPKARDLGAPAIGRQVGLTDFSSSRLARTLVVVVAVKIAGLILIFDPASAQAFDGTKAAFSLAATWVMLALIGLALLRFGPGIVPRTRLHILVGSFVAANAVAALFAQDRYIGLVGTQRHLGLMFVFDMAVLYASVALAYRSVKDWSLLGAAIGSAGLVAIVYGFVQYAGLDPISWAEFTRQRPPSTFGNADKLGHFLGTTFVAAIVMVGVLARSDVRRARILAAIYAVAALGATGVIATRGTLLGIVAAMPAMGILFFRLTQARSGRTMIIGAVGLLSGAMLVTGVVLFATPLGERTRGGFTDIASQQRLFIADAAMRAFGDRPLIGHGPDNFGAIYPRYRPPASAAAGLVNQDSAHSWLLQSLATTGLLGTASLAAVALTSLVLLWRGIAASPHVAAPLFVCTVAYWTSGLVAIGSPSVDWIGWVSAGAAATFGRPVAAESRRRVPRFAPVIAGVAALLLIVSAYPAFQAGREVNVARAAQRAGRADRAIPPAERAVALDSGRAEHWYALGVARLERGMFASASDALKSAVDRAPHVSAYWSSRALALANLSRVGDNSLGGREAALAVARRGAEVDPHSPAPHYVVALVANVVGDHAVALDAATVAMRLNRNEAGYETAAADAALRLQDPQAARSALESLIKQKDSSVLRLALARISMKLNDLEAARAHLRRAIEIDPTNAPARELLLQLG